MGEPMAFRFLALAASSSKRKHPRGKPMAFAIHSAGNQKNPDFFLTGNRRQGTRFVAIDFNLNPHTHAFDLGNAHALAHAAQLAYKDGDAIESAVFNEWSFNDLEFFDVDETQCFVASDAHAVVVAFRGTEPDSFSDWITDASVDLVDGPLGGKVHAGFYEALSNVWQLVDDAVARFDEHQQKTLLVTGHSLGGALATLAVARWLNFERPVQGLYTFGQPRTGDHTFARNFDFVFKPYAFRFVNNNDLVTRIPPRSFGYRHIGSFKYFTEDGQFAEEISWWRQFLDGWRGRIDDMFEAGDDAIKDHSMTHYLDRIENSLKTTSIPLRRNNSVVERLQRFTQADREHFKPRRRAA